MAQILKPAADAVDGNWLPSTGADLYATIDEAVADDGDYIYVVGSSECEVDLEAGSDPGVNTGHTVRYRAFGDDVHDLRVSLWDNSGTPFEVAAWTELNVAPGVQAFSHDLSGTQADSITSYTALSLKFKSIERRTAAMAASGETEVALVGTDGAGAGIAAVGSPVVGVSGSFGTTCTMSVTPSGTNRAIIVLVAWQTHGALPSSVVFNGSENFTEIGSDISTGSRSFAAYILLNPTATTANVVVTFAGTGFSTAVAQCMSGVDQTTPTAGWATTLDQTDSTMSHTIGSVGAGEWTFDVVSASNVDGCGTTQEADQTSICSQGRGVASGAGGMGASYNDADTGTVTFDWNPGFVADWSAGKFRLLPA